MCLAASSTNALENQRHLRYLYRAHEDAGPHFARNPEHLVTLPRRRGPDHGSARSRVLTTLTGTEIHRGSLDGEDRKLMLSGANCFNSLPTGITPARRDRRPQMRLRHRGISAHYCGMGDWVDDNLAFPDQQQTPPPNDDLSGDIRKDYQEAANILTRSPRGAAAILLKTSVGT